ncbi:glutathione S-transferase [Geosmithia morbida]|uniref:Glutathione S-transferase n=1 Tax=Geosmithia morbida TaxID=1094350 RepID=A0A9P4YU91_9HYPO|nr:glutathione S-transferase [Geosmithia morbida]KAF4121781.1 glutathione S-transferase [Geosmithia morbida]
MAANTDSFFLALCYFQARSPVTTLTLLSALSFLTTSTQITQYILLSNPDPSFTMALTIVVPDEYGHVLVAIACTFFVNIYHGFVTGHHRKASGVLYPNAYASDELAKKDPKVYKFNCAQRCHSNFLENYVSVLPALLISGLRFPITSAILGVIWCVGRVIYTMGYTSDSGPKGRLTGGGISHIGDVGLYVLCTYTAVMTALRM